MPTATSPSPTVRSASARTTALGWLAVVGLIVVAVVVFRLAQSGRSAAEAADADVERYQLIEARSRLAWIHFDLLTEALYLEAQGSEVSTERLAVFAADRRDALADLGAVAAEAPALADEVTELLDGYDEPFREWPYQAFELEFQHYLSFDPDIGTSLRDEPELVDMLHATMLPRLVLVDALAVDLVDRTEGPPSWAAEYLDDVRETARFSPGWLGPDRANPLDDNVITGRAPAELAVSTALRLVWDYDQWLIEAAVEDFDAVPVLSLAMIHRSATSAAQQLQSEALASVEAAGDDAAAASGGEGAFAALFAISGLATLAAVGLLITLLIRRHRLHTALADAIYTDPLTGARNRRFLDERCAVGCRRPNRHKVVAMIDLDRFKMINDTWGHDVGDLLLVTVAHRLAATVASFIVDGDEASADVIRLGGDEFAVVIQSPVGLSIDRIERSLRGVNGPVDVGLDEPVELEMSLGLVETTEPADLGDLLKGADLAAYEDKRDRSQRLPSAMVGAVDGTTVEQNT